jgi:hypothetical protein
MLKAQLARALQLPLDTRADQELHLLRELEEPEEPAASPSAEPGDPAEGSRAEERDCDRVIAVLRARLAER